MDSRTCRIDGASRLRQHKIAAIPGDGIGKEVIPADARGARALAEREAASALRSSIPLGLGLLPQHGRLMPEDGLDTLPRFDAILFGAVGNPTFPITYALGLAAADLPGARPIRQCAAGAPPARHHSRRCATARPAISIGSSCARTAKANMPAIGGRVHRGLPEEVATETAIFTRAGVERIMRFAFALARSGRGGSSPSSPSRTPSATAWCCGTRSPPRSAANSPTYPGIASWSTP